MAQYRINVGGVNIGLIDTADTGSKDAGSNATPQAAPNTPVNTGGSKTVTVNFNSVSPAGQVLSQISNPG